MQCIHLPRARPCYRRHAHGLHLCYSDPPVLLAQQGAALSICLCSRALAAQCTAHSLQLSLASLPSPSSRLALFRERLVEDAVSVPRPSAAASQWRMVQLYLARGKMVGGSSSSNATLYMRGSRADYDRWNMPGWTSQDALHYFIQCEDNREGGRSLVSLVDVVAGLPAGSGAGSRTLTQQHYVHCGDKHADGPEGLVALVQGDHKRCRILGQVTLGLTGVLGMLLLGISDLQGLSGSVQAWPWWASHCCCSCVMAVQL